MGTVHINSVTINNFAGSSGDGPFRSKNTITSIDLGQANWASSVLTNTFLGCSNLTTITNFPNTIQALTGGIFYGCSSLTTLPKLPDSIKSIYSGSTSVTPFQNTKINNTDFLPNSVLRLDHCFYNCNYLTTVNYLPNSIKSLYYTFQKDYSLTTVLELPSACANYQNTFWGCRNLTTIPPIPQGAIDMNATFSGCTQLTDIYILSMHVNTAYYCFNGTSIQKNVYIPYNASLGIYTITYNTFNSLYGTGQNGVILKENPYFETYGDWWWCNYDGMIHKYLGSTTPITIPNSINGKTTGIDGVNTFQNSAPRLYSLSGITDLNLNNVRVTNNLRYFCNYCKDLVNITGLNIDNTITDATFAFNGCINLKTTPTLPNSITQMQYAFGYCSNLTITPTIPTSTNSLISAFVGCRNISSMPVIPNSVTNMYNSFYNCQSLQATTINIPENVTNLTQTFYNCQAITGNIYIKSNQVANAYNCFHLTTATKNVYIPFKNSDGTYSATYNTFNQYYGSGQNGVTLVNYTDLYS